MQQQAATATEEVYLTDTQVAQITGRAKSTLQKDRVRRVGIPYIKIGRTIRYTLTDVHKYMESNRIETDPNN